MPDTAFSRFSRYLFTPVPNSPLVLFRVLFGLIMMVECWGAILTGWVEDVFISTRFNFTFIGFEGLQALHGPVMHGYYALMGLMALLVALGFRYRISATLLALLWAGAYFAEKTHYNNHYYLMVLLCCLMAVVPAQQRWSLDARFNPAIRSNYCFRWHRLLFVVQIAIVYGFAAIAKMNSDWMHAQPLNLWLPGNSDLPVIGPWLAKESTAWTIAYVGFFFDLLIVPMMLWKRTRIIGLVLSVFFHIGNSIIFQIGTFPYLALALLVFFYPPSLFDKLVRRTSDEALPPYPPRRVKFTTIVLCAYVCWQAFLPLRHWFFPGDVAWTEEGHRMAWRMMLRSKSGHIDFHIRDKKTGNFWIESPYKHLTGDAAHDVATHPDITWQYVQFLKDSCSKAGMDVSIKGIGSCSVNGGPYAPLIDTATDLAALSWQPFSSHRWLTSRPAKTYQ